ncbi:MAG: ATP-binding protein [bacterium]|nr:ATP-binding protein [bacterium]
MDAQADAYEPTGDSIRIFGASPSLVLVGGATVLLIAASITLSLRQAEQHQQATALAEASRRFDRTIGYGGFIHHFKNAVLRPNEPVYLHRAQRELADVQRQLVDLEQRLRALGVAGDLEKVRRTFDEYGERLRILAEHDRGLTARDLDALVRVSDDAALRSLADVLSALDTKLREEYRQFNRLIALDLTLIAVLLLVGLYLAARVDQVRRRYSQVLTRENLELTHANDDLRSFSYALTHDMKAPSNTARMLLREVRDHPTRELALQDKAMLDKADGVLARAQTLIADVLDYAQLAGEEQFRLERTDLNAVCQEVVAALESDIQEAEAEVIVAPHMPVMEADPLQIRLLLQNLIANAVKYRRPEASCQVHIAAARSADRRRVDIRVADNGRGIAPEFHGRIFEMFQRLEGPSEIAGSGLGLAICARVAVNHGGSIAVDSHPPAPGSAFTVTVPDHVPRRTRNGPCNGSP